MENKNYSTFLIEEKEIDYVIEINEIKSKTLTDLILHKEIKKEEIEKLQACRRFIRQFINELIVLKSTLKK